jgi:hypothetical protein
MSSRDDDLSAQLRLRHDVAFEDVALVVIYSISAENSLLALSCVLHFHLQTTEGKNKGEPALDCDRQ